MSVKAQKPRFVITKNINEENKLNNNKFLTLIYFMTFLQKIVIKNNEK